MNKPSEPSNVGLTIEDNVSEADLREAADAVSAVKAEKAEGVWARLRRRLIRPQLGMMCWS